MSAKNKKKKEILKDFYFCYLNFGFCLSIYIPARDFERISFLLHKNEMWINVKYD